MAEVNSALETCGLRQNAGKLVILPSLRRTVENRKFSRRKQEYQIKSSHRFLGIVYPAMLSMGAEIDQRLWATNRAWKELYGMWWDNMVPYKIKRTLFRGAVCGASLTGRTALLFHDRDYLRLQRCFDGSCNWKTGGNWRQCSLSTSGQLTSAEIEEVGGSRAGIGPGVRC